MSTLPESLRRVLAAQKSNAAPSRVAPSLVTTIWRDGEVYKQSASGAVRQLRSIKPIT
jgi:hypothetical protein